MERGPSKNSGKIENLAWALREGKKVKCKYTADHRGRWWTRVDLMRMHAFVINAEKMVVGKNIFRESFPGDKGGYKKEHGNVGKEGEKERGENEGLGYKRRPMSHGKETV